MTDQLRDQIAKALSEEAEGSWHWSSFYEPKAQAVIDALDLEHVEGRDGEWRYVTRWYDTDRPF